MYSTLRAPCAAWPVHCSAPDAGQPSMWRAIVSVTGTGSVDLDLTFSLPVTLERDIWGYKVPVAGDRLLVSHFLSGLTSSLHLDVATLHIAASLCRCSSALLLP